MLNGLLAASFLPTSPFMIVVGVAHCDDMSDNGIPDVVGVCGDAVLLSIWCPSMMDGGSNVIDMGGGDGVGHRPQGGVVC